VSAGDSDTSGHRLSIAVSRQVSDVRTVGLKGSYALRNSSDDTGDNDYRLWNASVFWTTTVAGRWTFNGDLGVTGLTSDTGGSQAPSFFSTTSLTYQFARAILGLSVNQGFSETFSGGQNFGVVDTSSYTASLSYPFAPTLSGTVAGFFQRNGGTGIGNVDTPQGDDESWGGTLDFSLRLFRTMSLGLGYSYVRQSGGSDYTENRVRASLGITF
jgi:hypothetical protein